MIWSQMFQSDVKPKQTNKILIFNLVCETLHWHSGEASTLWRFCSHLKKSLLWPVLNIVLNRWKMVFHICILHIVSVCFSSSFLSIKCNFKKSCDDNFVVHPGVSLITFDKNRKCYNLLIVSSRKKYKFSYLWFCLHVELAWHSGRVMDCHATAWGSIPGGNAVKTELHILRKGQ